MSARLVTPMVVPVGGAPHLDALLAWAMVQRALRQGPMDQAAMRAVVVPVVQDAVTGCPQASQLVAVPGGAAWVQAMARRLDVDTLLTDSSRGVVSLGDKGQLSTRSGKLRTYFRTVPREWIIGVVGWVVGDAAAIADLLSEVRNVGPLARADAGRIAPDGWAVTADPRARERWRWRHLPSETPALPEDLPGAESVGALAAPYWDRRTWTRIRAPQWPADRMTFAAEVAE